MGNQDWNLTVAYDSASETTTITGPNGTSADETVYRGETDTITFTPGSGVRSVTGITISDPRSLPPTVSISQVVRNNTLVVTDVNSLNSTDADVTVTYCVNFVDSQGNAILSDPKVINKSAVRPSPSS